MRSLKQAVWAIWAGAEGVHSYELPATAAGLPTPPARLRVRMLSSSLLRLLRL